MYAVHTSTSDEVERLFPKDPRLRHKISHKHIVKHRSRLHNINTAPISNIKQRKAEESTQIRNKTWNTEHEIITGIKPPPSNSLH